MSDDDMSDLFQEVTGQQTIEESQEEDEGDRVRGEEGDTRQVTSDYTCPECGHGEAYYEFLQTRAADEPPTKLLECTDCGHTWRDYS